MSLIDPGTLSIKGKEIVAAILSAEQKWKESLALMKKFKEKYSPNGNEKFFSKDFYSFETLASLDPMYQKDSKATIELLMHSPALQEQGRTQLSSQYSALAKEIEDARYVFYQLIRGENHGLTQGISMRQLLNYRNIAHGKPVDSNFKDDINRNNAPPDSLQSAKLLSYFLEVLPLPGQFSEKFSDHITRPTAKL